jgi:hypothetical protein
MFSKSVTAMATIAFSVVSSVSSSTSTLHCTEDCLRETEPYGSPRMYGVMEEKKIYWNREREMGMIGISSSTGSATCVDGMAAGYPCSGIDLLSFVSLADLGSSGGNPLSFLLFLSNCFPS